MIKNFYIFRHGQSSYNVEGRIQGQTNDSVLTELGRSQAVALGEKLQSKNIEVMVSSPLLRALQTAELVNKSLNIPIVIDKHFIEVNVGEVEGLPYNDVIKKYPQVYKQLHSPNIEECFDVRYPQGETKREVQKRIFAGLDYWLQQPYNNIAISTHGIALAQIYAQLDHYTTDIPNCTVLHLINDETVWKIGCRL